MLLIFGEGIDNDILVKEQRFNFKIFFNGEAPAASGQSWNHTDQAHHC